MEAPQERPAKAHFVFKAEFKGDVELRDLTFTYPGKKTLALKNISFKLKVGEKVAILGPIGSGKSTILKLLLKLYEPDSGSVMLDDIDASHVNPAMVRSQVGYMPQNAQLFSGTIRTNIALHAPHSGDEELVRAARQSGALEWINQRSAGFDAPVGKRGDGLSGGQRQSVALARAFLRDPPVLLLDDPRGRPQLGLGPRRTRSYASGGGRGHRLAGRALSHRIPGERFGRRTLVGQTVIAANPSVFG